MRSAFIFSAFVLSIGASAQQTAVTGPVEGFTFDHPTMSLRPVVGSLGSASLGTPVFGRISFASAAPRQNYALIFHDDQCSLLAGLGSAKTSMLKVPGSFTLPEGVAWSADGSTAILYSRTGNWIQVLSGLPSAVNPGTLLSVAPLGGTLATVAADSHGEQVAIGLTGNTSGVYRIGDRGSFVPLLSISNPVALGFSDDAATLYAVDAASDQAFALTMADLASQSWPLNGMTDPVAIKSARDASNRAVVYIAGRNDRLLAAYDSATHELLANVQLSFEPNVIQPLGIDTFVLASRANGDDILWSFRNTPQPTVYFVPALPLQVRESAHK